MKVVEVLKFWAWVNVPPTTMVLPTLAIDWTVPSRMLGALVPGSSLTILPVCGSAFPCRRPGPPVST